MSFSSASLSVDLSVCLSACLFICLSPRLSACVAVAQSFDASAFCIGHTSMHPLSHLQTLHQGYGQTTVSHKHARARARGGKRRGRESRKNEGGKGNANNWCAPPVLLFSSQLRSLSRHSETTEVSPVHTDRLSLWIGTLLSTGNRNRRSIHSDDVRYTIPSRPSPPPPPPSNVTTSLLCPFEQWRRRTPYLYHPLGQIVR